MSSDGLIRRSATSIAAKVAAFTRKHGSTPTVAIRMPATAGPAMRAMCTSALLRLTAFTTRSAPTISITKLWRVGLSTARNEPRRNTSANTIQGSTAPALTSAHSATAGTTIAAWVTMSSRRLSKRSARTPPKAPNSSSGANWSAVFTPTASALSVSWRMSQVSATIWTQLPLSDTTCPVKYRR